MNQSSKGECLVCRDIKKKQLPGVVVLVSDQDLEPGVPPTTKKLKPHKKKDFLTILNAIINEGGGLVCLHGVNPHRLGSFDQSLNAAMAALIPDGTSYPDNFERHLERDNHVIFRVKQRERPLSTYCFNTKISYDKGVEDPTHAHMKCFLMPKEEEDEQRTTAHPSVIYIFEQGKEVKFKLSNENRAAAQAKEIVFQEGIAIQAKQVPRYETGPGSETIIENMTLTFFDTNKPSTFLPKYFAAFSKLSQGGSILLGIEEEKIADINTGAFKCQGVYLTEEERRAFREVVMDKAKKVMYWHPDLFAANKTLGSDSPSFRPPIEVKFHPVGNGSVKLVVPEIVVHKYYGMAFTDKDGPKAFRIQRLKEVEGRSFNVVPVSTKDWLDTYKELWCETCHNPKDVKSCLCPE